jgi:hypothetical protein
VACVIPFTPNNILENEPSKVACLKHKMTPHGKNAFYLIFSLVNDNKKVDHNNLQMMHCILCCNPPINASNPKTQARKNLISYYKTNGIITIFNKHVITYHAIIAKPLKRE